MMADYISREAAVEILRPYKIDPFKIGFLDDNIDGFNDGIETAISCIGNEVPAADVRPVVHGAWERPKGSTPRSWIFVCSKCGDRAYFPVPKYFPKGCGYKFCPNCGADMR